MDHVTSVIRVEGDCSFTISSDGFVIYSLDVYHAFDVSYIRNVLCNKFYQSGVSHVSDSCNITLELHSTSDHGENKNIMECVPSKSADKRANILSSVIKELMSRKDKLSNNNDTQMFI